MGDLRARVPMGEEQHDLITVTLFRSHAHQPQLGARGGVQLARLTLRVHHPDGDWSPFVIVREPGEH